jgi:glycosidase
MLKNPKLYEINTRVWITQFGRNSRLSDIPEDYFRELRKKGFDIVWLMGIWKTCPSVIKDCCFSVDLVSAYNKSLKDWSEPDVVGSPYSIDDYIINPSLGDENDLLALKEKINSTGMKLFLDFIPNHFSADTHLIQSVPDLFLPGDEELLHRDSYTFFIPREKSDKIFAHGRDPLFPPWTDTIQVNYFSETAREFMTNTLLRLTKVADGIRCDMAMLPLNNVFHNTWIGIINKFNFKKPACEFWSSAIQHVKAAAPDFIFLGEAYWDLEWNLQQFGFDFTYDKRLTDRLAFADLHGIKAHLAADRDFQAKSVRFIENHDEPRAVTRFGKQKSLAAATVISTIQGMRFYYDGQFEGKRIKLPVQLGRQPDERVSRSVSNYYNILLQITQHQVFTLGEWKLLEVSPAAAENFSYENFLVWQWKYGNQYALVVINYYDSASQCRIRFRLENTSESVYLVDVLTGEEYKRSVKELTDPGLFVELKGYQSHIFMYSI